MRVEADGRPKLNLNNALFKVFRDKDEISVAKVGKKFLQNRLAGWRRLGLVEGIYATDSHLGRRTLRGAILTTLGKSYFQRESNVLTLKTLLEAVAEVKNRHPQIDVRVELQAGRAKLIGEIVL